MGKPFVIRVRGIEQKQKNDEEAWLRSVILAKLRQGESCDFQVEIVPTCETGDDSSMALVDFIIGLPSFLGDLDENEFDENQIETDRGTLVFDRHFHGFTQLYTTDPNHPIVLDIVAVTGLDGHAYGSWCGKKYRKMWLRHFLRHDLPNCRTMIYGYNSRLYVRGHHTISDYDQCFTTALVRVRSTDTEKKRPIIFVGHSFGGLIIKHCLLESHFVVKEEHLKTAIYQSTHGILFFGTPHLGLNSENLQNIKILLTDNHPRLELLQSLEPNHPSLIEQGRRFKEISSQFKVVCYIEKLETPRITTDPSSQKPLRNGPSVLAADENTSRLQLPTSMECIVAVDKDHSNMVKFESSSDETYKDVKFRLAEFRKTAPQSAKGGFLNLPERKLPLYRLPPKPLCIGRDKEIKLIIAKVMKKLSVAILGAGGMGKTTLALAVLHSDQIVTGFEARFFVNCEGITTLELLYTQLADALRLPKENRDAYLSDMVLDALSKRLSVVCLDNFESLWDLSESRTPAEEYLSRLSDLTTLIVTMRGSERPSCINHECKYLLSPVSHLDACKIFQEVAGYCDEYGRKLIDAVERLPLAVTLLSRQTDRTIESAEALWKRWHMMRTAVISRPDAGHRLSNLDISIQLSLESPRLGDKISRRRALGILALLPAGIDELSSIFIKLDDSIAGGLISSALPSLTATALAYIDQDTRRHKVLSPIREFVRRRRDKFIGISDVTALIDHYAAHMVGNSDYSDPKSQIIQTELLNVHSLLTIQFEDDQLKERVEDITIDAIKSYSDWMYHLGTPSDDLLLLALQSHNLTLARQGDCFRRLGSVHEFHHMLRDAEKWLLQAIKAHRESQDILGEGTDRLKLEELYMRQHRLDEAESSLQQAVVLHQQSQDGLGEGTDRLRLAERYMQLDQLNEAESSLQRAVELHQQSHDFLSEGSDRLMLGELYMRLDKLDEAESSLQQALDLHQQSHSILGEGTDRARLGELYMRLDRLDEAESSLLRAVELHQQSHSILNEGIDRARLGELYMRLDRLDEAESSLLLAIELHRQSHAILNEGSDRLVLGGLYVRLDRLDEAESSLRRAVMLHRQSHSVLGEGSDRLALGELYMRLNRLDEAELSLRVAVQLHQKSHAVLNEGTDRARLGELYMRLNQLDRAESSLLQAIQLHQQSHAIANEGSDRARLGELYMRLDRLEEAESLLLRAVELHQQSHAVLNEGTDRAKLGELYMRLDRLGDAKQCLLSALKLHRQAHSFYNEAIDMGILGELYLRSGEMDLAEAHFLSAIELSTSSGNPRGERFWSNRLTVVRQQRDKSDKKS